MFYIIFALIIGSSFFPLLFPKFHIWLTQGLWIQMLIGIGFSWSFYQVPKQRSSKNLSLTLLHLWVAGQIALICFISQMNGKYDIIHFLPYFNFLCMLIFYNLIVQYLNREHIIKILNGLRYVVIATLFICVLQYLGYSQFFQPLYKDRPDFSQVVGFIGNGTHTSGFLASCAPLFFIDKKRENYLALILLVIILCFTGTTVNDPAISGFIVLICTISYIFRRYILWIALGFIIFIALAYPHIPHNFIGTNGRIGWLKLYMVDLFKQNPITGVGLGSISVIAPYTEYKEMKHLHMEYFHYAFELGLVGICIIIEMIRRFFHIKDGDYIQTILKAMVLGFLVSCLFNYPSHLWLPATVAMFCYASYLTINKEVQNGIIKP